MISNTGIFIHFIYRGSVHKRKKGNACQVLFILRVINTKESHIFRVQFSKLHFKEVIYSLNSFIFIFQIQVSNPSCC